MRQHLHQLQGQVQEPAGVRMLRRLARIAVAVGMVAALSFSGALRADVEDCRDAISAFKSARSGIAGALQAYVACVTGSDGDDDCSVEFGALSSAQDDFESAVSNYEGDCS